MDHFIFSTKYSSNFFLCISLLPLSKNLRSVSGDDNPVSSQNDSCDDSESSVEDEHADQNRVLQDGLLEELEVCI